MTPFDLPPRRRMAGEPIVPMINVVFLLLVFFLLTAQIAPPDPVDVVLPIANAEADTSAGAALYLPADGDIAFGDLRGDDAIRAAVAAGPVALRADAGADARDLADVLARLAAAGAEQVSLQTEGAL